MDVVKDVAVLDNAVYIDGEVLENHLICLLSGNAVGNLAVFANRLTCVSQPSVWFTTHGGKSCGLLKFGKRKIRDCGLGILIVLHNMKNGLDLIGGTFPSVRVANVEAEVMNASSVRIADLIERIFSYDSIFIRLIHHSPCKVSDNDLCSRASSVRFIGYTPQAHRN